MEWFTAYPERILGNVARSSLVGGAPSGLLAAALGGALYSHDADLADWATNLLTGAALGVCFVALFGFLILAPLLAALRRAGYGGPMAVIGISSVAVIGLAASEPAFLPIAALLAFPSAYVFCKYAYQDEL